MPQKTATTKRKRLFFDIETSPNIGLFFEAGSKKYIGYESILKERAIICICWKWEDRKEVDSLHWDGNQCDKKMLEKFIKIANEADEIIGHNGDNFDIKWIRTRCLFHGISMMPKYVSIDTLKVSRSKFRFNSNRLDYIGQYLGLGKKIKTDYSLWKEILLNKSAKHMDSMIKYCQQDVRLLEKVYKKMSSHIEVKTHFGVIFKSDRGSCPECGSDELMINNTRVTASGIERVCYQCQTCHKYHTKTRK